MNHGQLRCKQVYVAFGLCTSIGKPCNVLSVMHVHMYVRLVRNFESKIKRKYSTRRLNSTKSHKRKFN